MKFITKEVRVDLETFSLDPLYYLQKALEDSFICITDNEEPILIIGDYLGVIGIFEYATKLCLEKEGHEMETLQ